MYRIKNQQRQAARKLGVTIRPSTLKNKKIDVYKDGFKVASIGDIRYNDYWIYKSLERQGYYEKGYADERRELYRLRHREECNAKGTPGYYACKILW